ncbi:MAG: alpha-galactosidase [Firmicutes bacterium]|nr:alpha-galactosidase [Bacillota bacterium]
MGIIYDETQRIFHLQSREMSYLCQVKYGYLAHLYWGGRLREGAGLLRFGERPFAPAPVPENQGFSLDTLPQEYPGYGTSDFRGPAYQVQLENGATVTELLYKDYEIQAGKPKLAGLPGTYVEDAAEAATLNIRLEDKAAGLMAVLSYTVYENLNVLTRSARLVNCGKENLRILRALSMCMDFNDAKYELLHLPGAWAREREMERRPLITGVQSIESRRGASSHQHNPFMALLRPGTNEDYGEVYGLNLVYSGNFLGQVEVDQYRTARVMMGVNPFDFSWLLTPGESFQTPEVVMVFSDQGLGKMSRTFHQLYRTRLCRGKFRDQARPVLINNWEGTYFDFTADRIAAIAEKAAEMGIELMVLDDGWFGRRNDDKSSLGDWFVNREKLPLGLKDLAGRVNKLGLKFGLWFEPEMISPDSELYRQHPDWCLHVPGRRRTEGRHQLVLDLSRDEVCQAVVAMISDILKSAPVSYVKWDMNRHMTEIGSAGLPPERQRETAHRYMLNLYRMMEEITAAFPEVLFEGCSGGGGRFDPGILYYMPQIWTSDNTDAVCRLKIQYGTSLAYPVIAMGAHVSAVPNHQVGRVTPLEMRGLVAGSGNFGYELDLNKLAPRELELVKEQVAWYKEIRGLVQFGELYRLLSPFEGNEAAWMFVSEDKTEAVVFYFRVLAEPNTPCQRLRLKGLDGESDYEIVGEGKVYGADMLTQVGIDIPEEALQGDYKGVCWRLKVNKKITTNDTACVRKLER